MKPARRNLLSALALFLLVATASQAVIIYFKDGSKEVIADSYRIDGQRLIAVLQSGQETAIRLDAVDLEKTEAMAKVAKGSAVVIDHDDRRAGRRDRAGPHRGRSDARALDAAHRHPPGASGPRALCATRPPATSTSSARRVASSLRRRAPS